MSRNNILVATLGTWAIIPELLGFTNPRQLDLYKHHPARAEIEASKKKYKIQPVDQVWLVSTDSTPAGEGPVDRLIDWNGKLQRPFNLKFFLLKDVADLNDSQTVQAMTDLIYRVVLHAAEACGQGQLLLSLAGGRKTMSADLQQAAHLFGCHAVLHVLDNPQLHQLLPVDYNFSGSLPAGQAAAFTPLVVQGRQEENVALKIPPQINADGYPLDYKQKINRISADGLLLQDVEKRLKDARHLLVNYSLSLSRAQKQNNYRALYALPPAQIEQLQKFYLARDAGRADHEIDLLQKLPKAELHCHLGGILDAQDLIAVAMANQEQIHQTRKRNPAFNSWLEKVRRLVKMKDVPSLLQLVPDVRKLRQDLFRLPPPLTVAGFLSQFDGFAQILDRFIFGKYQDAQTFSGIGIDRYEKLGDLQGSALLQSEASLRQACRILAQKCRDHNVRYLELRHSPVKYTAGGLTAKQVTEIIRDELAGQADTTFRAIIIASRHGRIKEIEQHVQLAGDLLREKGHFSNWLVGFDLAGAESSRSPAVLRNTFLPLMQLMINLTIHAGETAPVSNVWEAVYHLNADRIGHGLTLNDNDVLKRRFLDKKTTIEMCPSSNKQIVGYRNFLNNERQGQTYPLAEYLRDGLRVTVNTDNPGISRTNFTQEYYQAAALSPDGLSLWEILQIIRNGFRAAFVPFDLKQKLLVESEREIMDFIRHWPAG